jgi:hydroxymethylpyrimidine pyrophosphatase-like HAD family hydrolase
MINLTLKSNNILKRFSISDAKEFIAVGDSNNDNKLSKSEMFELFRKVIN